MRNAKPTAQLAHLLALPAFKFDADKRTAFAPLYCPDGKTPEPAAVTALRVRAGLGHLINGIAAHDPESVKQAITVLGDFTEHLNAVLLQERAFALPWTRRRFTLPLTLGRNRDLQQRAGEILDRLEVGADVPANILQTGTGKAGNPHGVRAGTPRVILALDLFRHVTATRAALASAEAVERVTRAHGLKPDGWRDTIPPLAQQMAKLAEFSPQSAREWADVAIQVLESACGPVLSERHELRALLPAGFDPYAKTAKAKKAAARHELALAEWKPWLSKPERRRHPDTQRKAVERAIRREIRAAFAKLAEKTAL
jgi:hypothetical protein